FVRTEVSGQGNQGQLWLRVDRPQQRMGFFDNMGDRPITGGDWREYVIEGDVADDATSIVFGAFLMGAGVLQVDDFELSVQRDDGVWAPIVAANPGFEEQDDSGQPTGWMARTEGYRYRIESEDAHSGSGSLMIEGGSYARGAIFDAIPEVGETVTKPLGGGLTARIPLALYGDSARTLEPDVGVEPETLRTALDGLRRDSATADDASVRLAAVIVAWNVFQHFYPYFDVVVTDWDAELTNALSGALSDQTAEDFHDTLSRLVAALHDGHGRVFHPTVTPNAELPMRLSWIGNELVIVEAVDTSSFQPGDIIRSIDGDDVRERLPTVEALISGSTQWKRYRAAREIGVGAAGSEAVLRFTRGETTFESTVVRVQQPAIPSSDEASVRELEPGIWYVDLDVAEMTEISQNIDSIASAEGVVFDLRGYPNGNHGVLSHLLAEPDTSVKWMRVQQAIYPDRERIAGWGEFGWSIQPMAPLIQGRVVFLTDGSAISYAESFMSFVEHYRLAEIVGSPTAGANGNVNPLTLPGGFRVTWTGMRVLKHDGAQHHNIGIQPTVPLEPTIEGIRAKRDELLERAVEIIAARPRSGN
ncbi:MAG: S41 family peptidase, partial [Gemmatimonadota bacterium]|nr:S41 family peptidase [Gemmatimonadota bacterium]